MPTIVDVQTMTGELVLQERRTTSDFLITQINENVVDRKVQVEVELGPFTSVVGDNGTTVQRGQGGRHLIQVWQGDQYDSIRDSWDNAALMAAVKAILDART